MQPIVRNNLQLYSELCRQNRSDTELRTIKAAYDLGTQLYSGYCQADGRPFISHTIGVAGLLAQMGMPAEIIAVGLLHNVYGNGDFGDGRAHVVTEFRKQIVAAAVGPRIALLLHRFRSCRVTTKSVDDIEAKLDGLDETDRHLVLVDLADYCEKYVDLGVLYFGDSTWITEEVEVMGARLIQLARRLEQPELAELMASLFQAVEQHPAIPAAILPPIEHRYPYLVLPLSAKMRLRTIAAGWYRRNFSRRRWRR